MTGRLARAAARHPWRTIGTWLAAIAGAAAAMALLLGSALTTEADVAVATEASEGRAIVRELFPETDALDELLVVPQGRAAEAADALRRLDDVARAGPPVPSGDVAAVPFALAADGEIDAVVPLAESLGGAVYGAAIIDRDFTAVSREDLLTGEAFGVAAALVVLVVVFGALVAALVPLVLALVAVAVALGLVVLIGQVWELSIFVTNMVAGMGLALGIDYSLFVVSRYREERRRGRPREDAIAAAGATASRAVLFSGVAVTVALVGILFVPDTVLRSLGVGAILVAATSVLAALTLLPAVLGILGDRVDALRLPLRGGRREGRFWAWVAERVMRRPLVSLLLAGGLLLAAAAPVLDLETRRLGVSTLPEQTEARQGFELLGGTEGRGILAPAQVVLVGDDRAAADDVAAFLRADPGFGAVAVERRANVTLVEAPVPGDPLAEAAFDAIRRLRSVVPDSSYVTGVSAGNLDYVETTNAARPLAFGFVFALSFLLLLVAFRSLVVPVKAILLNLLSVGAAYGLLVLVFQKGVGAGLLGFRQVDAIEVWVPVFLFSILFGLSMDYHVFLLSRIRERWLETGDNEGSVAFGVGTTGRIITGAALIIVVVFVGLALGDLVMFQQVGFGVAVALFLDATLVRSVLVPAAMRLLGGANWYLPRWLGWLPRVDAGSGDVQAPG